MSVFLAGIIIRALITLPIYIAVLIVLRVSSERFHPASVRCVLLCLMLPLILPAPVLTLPYNPATEILAAVTPISAAGEVQNMSLGNAFSSDVNGIFELFLGAVWLIGALTVAVSRIARTAALCRSIGRLTLRTESRGHITVRYCSDGISPMAYGIFRPTVVLSDGDAVELRELFYRHELAHISRGDIIIRYIMTVIRAVYWFDPIVGMLERALYEVSELVCDTDALADSDTESRRSYGHELIRRSCRHISVSLNTSFSTNAKKLKVRLEAVMTNTNKTPNKKRRIVLISIAAVLVLGCLLMTSMVYSTKTVTLGEVTVEIPGYWAVKKVSDDKFEFYSAGALAGELVKADDDTEYAAYVDGRLHEDGTRFLILAPPKDIDVLYSRGKLDRVLEGNTVITDGFYYGYSTQVTGCTSTYFLYLKAANSVGIPINPQSQADKIAQTLSVN